MAKSNQLEPRLLIYFQVWSNFLWYWEIKFSFSQFWICKFIFELLTNLSWNKLSSSGWTMRKIQHHPATLNKLWFQIKEYFFDYEKFQFRSNLIWTEIFSTLGKFFHKRKSETWCHKPMSWFWNRFAKVSLTSVYSQSNVGPPISSSVDLKFRIAEIL